MTGEESPLGEMSRKFTNIYPTQISFPCVAVAPWRQVEALALGLSFLNVLRERKRRLMSSWRRRRRRCRRRCWCWCRCVWWRWRCGWWRPGRVTPPPAKKTPQGLISLALFWYLFSSGIGFCLWWNISSPVIATGRAPWNDRRCIVACTLRRDLIFKKNLDPIHSC